MKEWNGPERDFREEGQFKEEMCYCVTCGSVFVYAFGRHCPACMLHEEIESINNELREIAEYV